MPLSASAIVFSFQTEERRAEGITGAGTLSQRPPVQGAAQNPNPKRLTSYYPEVGLMSL